MAIFCRESSPRLWRLPNFRQYASPNRHRFIGGTCLEAPDLVVWLLRPDSRISRGKHPFYNYLHFVQRLIGSYSQFGRCLDFTVDARLKLHAEFHHGLRNSIFVLQSRDPFLKALNVVCAGQGLERQTNESEANTGSTSVAAHLHHQIELAVTVCPVAEYRAQTRILIAQ